MRIGISCFGHKLGEAGGAQVYRHELIRALSQFDSSNEYVLLKWQTDTLGLDSLPANFAVAEFQLEPGDLIHRIKFFLMRYFFHRLPATFSRQLEGLRLDLIHFPTTVLYPQILTIPAVLTFFDMQQVFYPENFTWTELLRRRLNYRLSAEKAQLIISPSAFTAKTLMVNYKIALSKIRCIPVGVSERFVPMNDEQAIVQVRRRYQLPEKFAIYPANTWPHKNHRRLLVALAFLHKTYGLKINLVCAGARIQNHESLSEMAVAVDFPVSHLLELGFVSPDDMPVIYSAANLVIFPSLFEGFGIPVLEAMACGCPVVCSNTTSLPEVGGGAVGLFDPLDINSMAEVIRRVWEDQDLRFQMADKGFLQASHFQWKQVAVDTIGAYREVFEMNNPDHSRVN